MKKETLYIGADNHAKMIEKISNMKNSFIEAHAFTNNNPDGMMTTSFEYFYNYCCGYYNFTAEITLSDNDFEMAAC